MIYKHLNKSSSQMLTNRLCCVSIYDLCFFIGRERISIQTRTARRLASSPLLFVCVYFCCHFHAELEPLYVGVAFRQREQR